MNKDQLTQISDFISRHSDPRSETSIIGEEAEWRHEPTISGEDGSAIAATRWRSSAQGIVTTKVYTNPSRYIIEIMLRKTRVHLQVNGVTVLEGTAMPGCIHVTKPGATAIARYDGPCDMLHLHVPREAIDATLNGGEPSLEPFDQDDKAFYDPLVHQLAGTMLQAGAATMPFGHLYSESVCAAILARIMCRSSRAANARKRVSALSKWRLRRALEFVETHIQDPITLSDLAAATGLTRMHFAAQFKVAMGLRPHDYIVQRRIEQAQSLLRDSTASIVDVAFSVGFQTQAHFTTVFKRVVGQPPQMWRKAQDECLLDEFRGSTHVIQQPTEMFAYAAAG